MAKTPGGPTSGDMVTVQRYGIEEAKEKAAQQQQPVQREQQPPQERQSSSREDLEAAARQKNLEQNDRVKEARIREIAKDLAPKENPNRDQQQQQQNQKQRDERQR